MDSKNQRVGIFIDVQNLYHTSRNLFKARVNYSVLMKSLVRNRQLIRALAYVVKSDTVLAELARSRGENTSQEIQNSNNTRSERGSTAESAFFGALEEAGLELRVKDLQIFASGEKKADWDIGMAVDAVRMSPGLDVIILVTGDGDFIPLVEYLQSGLGKFVEVAAFKGATSQKLQEAADEFIDLRMVPKILLRR